MKRILNRALCAVSAVFFALSVFSVTASAESYYYDDFGESRNSPDGYTVTYLLDSAPDGTGLSEMTDMYIDTDGTLYILDTKNSRVITFDKDMNYSGTIAFSLNGEPITFSNAKGMYVREKDGEKIIYIADSDNHRIIKSAYDGKAISVILKPESDIFSENEDFFPEKILVSDSDTVFALCRGVYKGAVVFGSDGSFLGFYGSNKIKVTGKVLYDYAWKKMFGSKMTSASNSYVPIEFTNFDIDEKGFVYTITSSDSTDAVINRMNFKSGNLLSSSEFGDLENLDSSGKEKATEFIDIAYMQNGIFAALDRTRGRVFLYDKNGDNLMVFGNIGSTNGAFSQPTAIEAYQDRIYVYDNTLGSVTVFAPSQYGENVLRATRMYLDGNYADSIEIWNRVLEENQSFSLAYLSIGRALSGQNRNREAMEYFKRANAKADYSEVFREVRKDFLTEWLWLIMVILIIAAAAVTAIGIVKRKGRNTSSHNEKEPNIASVLSHPKRDIIAMVRSNSKIRVISFVILAVWFLTEAIAVNATGFIFSTARENPLNLGITLASTVGLVVGFVVTNWLIAAVFNGNGSFTEIFCVTAIALVPYIGARIIRTVMSNFCSLDESAFMGFVIAVGLLWSLLILLTGLSQIHEFGAAGTVGSFAFTLVGMVLILFLMLLLGSVVAQIVQLVQTVWGELLCMIV